MLKNRNLSVFLNHNIKMHVGSFEVQVENHKLTLKQPVHKTKEQIFFKR